MLFHSTDVTRIVRVKPKTSSNKYGCRRVSADAHKSLRMHLRTLHMGFAWGFENAACCILASSKGY